MSTARIMRIAATTVALAAFTAGCTFQRPSADQFTYINPPRFYQSTIPGYFATKLKDPESARYTYGTPAKAYANNGSLRGGDVAWRGYAVPVAVNAKNSYGGYTGNKQYIVLFNGDNPIHDTTEYDGLFHWLK